MEGWGPKSLAFPFKPRETRPLGGMSRDFCQDPEKFDEKLCVQFLAHTVFRHCGVLKASRFTVVHKNVTCINSSPVNYFSGQVTITIT